MRSRPLGKTGMTVSELSLGTWGLSGEGHLPVPEAEQDRLIDRAHALGIQLFETADSYAHGDIERRLGNRVGKQENVRIVTKIGTSRDEPMPRKRFDAEFLKQSVAKCQERQQREILDVVLLHNPSKQALERDETTGVLAELVNEKKLRVWGVSVSDTATARLAIEKGAGVLSLPYNAFHSNDLRELASAITKSEVGILAHSVLSYGLLCGHWTADKVFPEGDHRGERWTSDELRRRVRQLDALRPAVGGDVLTLRAVAVRFALANRSVSSVVLGPKSTLQLDQLIREAGKGPPYLQDNALAALRNRLDQVGAGN
jgi:aryl-alcohol dehydrogenase-like predicted oxidoreductase